MTIISEALTFIRADLARGLTPGIVTQPGQGVVTALCEEFDPVGILDMSNFGDRSDLINTLVEGITYDGEGSNIILIHNVELANADMTNVLRRLPTARTIQHEQYGEVLLPRNTQFIFVSHGRETGMVRNGVPLFEQYGIVLRGVVPHPDLSEAEVARELKNLLTHLDGLIAAEQKIGKTDAAEALLRMRKALSRTMIEKHNH